MSTKLPYQPPAPRMSERLRYQPPFYLQSKVDDGGWRTGVAVMVGEVDGRRVEACERVEFFYRLVMDDGDVKMDLRDVVEVGPMTVSVVKAQIVVFDFEDGIDMPLGWLAAPLGAGMKGYTVVLEPGKDFNG